MSKRKYRRIKKMAQSDDEEDYFSDSVKLIHTAEDRTFITDERFIDAEIIDLGDILSPEEDSEYDSPQKTQASVPTKVKTPDPCRDSILNPLVTLVDCCKRLSKDRRYPDTEKLKHRPTKVKHKHKSEDPKTDSDIEIIDQKQKTLKNNLNSIHEIEIKKAMDQRNKFQRVDIKKNKGLIGLIIKRPNTDLKKSFGKNCKENNSNEQRTNTTHTAENGSKKNKNHKVKTKNTLKKKDSKKYTTERIEKNKGLFSKKHLDKYRKTEIEKKTDISKSPMSKSTLSPKSTCGVDVVEKFLIKNVCENDTKTKKAMPVLTSPSTPKDKEHNRIKQKDILEKYTNLKDNSATCYSNVITQKNPKENERNGTEQSILMKFTGGQMSLKINNVEQRSFPKLNKFTKNVLKKVLKSGKVTPKINPVKTNQNEKHIRSNISLYMKEKNTSPNKEASQKSENLKTSYTKSSDSNFIDNNVRKIIKTDPNPKSFNSPKHHTNLNMESSLRHNQNLTASNRKIQSANYTPSPIAQTIEKNNIEASAVKLPFPFPSISSNTSSNAPQTNARLQHNVLNNNKTKETSSNGSQSTIKYVPIAPFVTDRNNIENPRHDIIYQYNKPPPQIQKQPVPIDKVDMTKPPPSLNGNILQKLNYVQQSFPDAKMMKKSPTAPHNMNLYRPPPPNTYAPYQYFYPMAAPSVPDNSGMYNVNNQNYGCRIGPYTLPYGTEIYLNPPPQPPPPPPPPPLPTLPLASQQQLQQTFSNTSQLTQNSIIGRNNDGVIKKINITAPTPIEKDISTTEVGSKEGVVKVNNMATNNTKNVNEVVVITPTVIKSEMLAELDTVKQPDNIAVFTHSPKTTLKRPLTTQFPIRDEKKNNKPCPLSKKVKESDPRTVPKKGQINKEQAKTGYSPPILPIPSFENILSQKQAYDIGLSHTIVEKSAKNSKNMVFPQRHGPHNEVRKITLDEYKKKNCIPSDKIRQNKYRT